MRPATLLALLAAVVPATAELRGLWKFDEASGTTAADTSGQPPINGVLVGGAVFQPAAGRFGGAVYLDGADDFVEVPDNGRFEFTAVQSFSVACWFKSDGDETTAEFQTNNGLVTKGYNTSSYTAPYYQLQVNFSSGTNSYFQFDSRQPSNTTPFRFPTSFPAGSQDVVNGQWHHFVAVIDRDGATPQARLYVNGQLYASQNFAPGNGGGQWDMGVNASPLVIGNHFNRYTKGWFDEVGIWNHALTPSEITALYTNGAGSNPDTDNDGLPDAWEMTHFQNLSHPAGEDFEPDGLTNLLEYQNGTDPKVTDTDGDGLTDGAEVNTHTTNPTLEDTDGDGLTDGQEINTYTTDPKDSDSDNDNFTDGEEVAAGTDPNNAASYPPPGSLNIHINEFVSENLPRPNDPTAPVDMDGDYPDWIEIKNNETTTVDLIGYHLSDDPLVLNKWTFPSTTIPAGGYRIVFASKKNRSVNGVEPHTNFKLPTRGTLILSRPDGSGGQIIVSQIGTALAQYPSQRQTFSYGRENNTAGGTLKYFSVPTPGAANSAATAVTQFVNDTNFTVDRGIYSAPFSTDITCSTPGATIAYTLDGSQPSPTNGTQVPAPDASSPPVATVNITTTTLLRARAWKTGLGSSNVDTQSYIFTSEVMTQNGPTPSMGLAPGDTLTWGTSGGDLSNLAAFPGLTFWGINQAIASDPVPDNRFVENDLKVIPILSLVSDWRGLFGPNSPGQTNGGIYPPASGVGNEGRDREASVELINPDGNPLDPNAKKGFQSTGNIHIFGGTSQNRWKTYKLQFRFQANTDIEYRIFGDDGFNRFKNFTLDPTINNTWHHPDANVQGGRSAFVRDFVMADLQNRMGQRGYHTRPAHLFINGMYWGIYWLHEKPDHHFSAAYYGGDSDNYDVFKHSTHPNFNESDPLVNTLPSNPALPISKATSANPAGNATCIDNFEALLDLLGTGNVGANPPTPTDLTIQANYEAVAAMLDIDAFIDYMMLNFVAGNQDWADKNLYASRHRNGGKWRFFSWDAEHTFRTGTENFINGGGNEQGPLRNGNPKQIHNRLRTNAEYRLKFADHIRRHMFNGGPLSVAGMTDAFNDRLDEIADAVRAESARWGHIRAAARSGANQNIPFKKSNWLTERNRLTVLESGGNSLLQNRWNLYMAPGTGQFRQVSNGPLYPSTEAPNFSQHGGSVPAGFTLTITNPNAGGTTYYTTDGSDPRIAWAGTVSGSAQTYTAPFPLGGSGTVKSRVLLGGVWSALTEAYFSVATVPASASNIVISEFNYNPSNATAAEIAAGFANANDFEYIELTNIGPDTVDLSGCAFTAGITFNFNTAAIRELAPGAKLLIVENAAAFTFRHGPGLPIAGEFELSTGLSNSGERLTLTAANGTTIKDFTYNDKAPWPVQADGDGWSLVLISPASNPDHSLPESWRPSALPDNGTPATTDITGFAAWKTTHGVTGDFSDDDKDGLKAALEYFLGTGVNTPDLPALSATIAPLTIGGLTENYFLFTFTHAAARDDVSWRAEIAASPAGPWDGTTAATRRVSITANGDGTVTEVWRSATPATGAAFARIAVSIP